MKRSLLVLVLETVGLYIRALSVDVRVRFEAIRLGGFTLKNGIWWVGGWVGARELLLVVDL